MPLASTGEPIIDPRKLKIVAFRVRGNRLSHQESVLHPQDIREISEIGIIVDSDRSLMQLEDLVRLKEVIGFNFKLDNIRVENEKGRLLGRVSSYAVDQESFFVQQLYTKPSLLRSIVTTGLTIHRTQISSINNHRIVVKDPTVPAKLESSKAPSPSFVNPFRAPMPTPPES
jgi:hypothetical protein